APAGKQVVDTDDLVAGVQQPFAQVGADEARATRNKHVHWGLSHASNCISPSVSQNSIERSIRKYELSTRPCRTQSTMLASRPAAAARCQPLLVRATRQAMPKKAATSQTIAASP